MYVSIWFLRTPCQITTETLGFGLLCCSRGWLHYAEKDLWKGNWVLGTQSNNLLVWLFSQPWHLFLLNPSPTPPLDLGTVKWNCFDLFGGALCVRRAWELISAAALEMWGVVTGLTFTFNVAQMYKKKRFRIAINRFAINLHWSKQVWIPLCYEQWGSDIYFEFIIGTRHEPLPSV